MRHLLRTRTIASLDLALERLEQTNALAREDRRQLAKHARIVANAAAQGGRIERLFAHGLPEGTCSRAGAAVGIVTRSMAAEPRRPTGALARASNPGSATYRVAWPSLRAEPRPSTP